MMMADNNRSELLQMTLPDDLAAIARQEGIDLDHAWLVTCTDLDLSGAYDQVFLVAEPGDIGLPAVNDSSGLRACSCFSLVWFA